MDRHRALRRALRDASAPVLDEPVPDRLLAMLREPGTRAGEVRPLAPRRGYIAPRRWALPEWAAIAAALVLGVAVSRWGWPEGATMFTRGEDGALVAGPALSGPLERQLAGDAPAGNVAVGISFRTVDGTYCRSFVADAAQPLAGLACRRADGLWRLPVVMDAARAAGGDLQPASSALPAAVLAELDARIAGEPLDAAQERAARDAGWR